MIMLHPSRSRTSFWVAFVALHCLWGVSAGALVEEGFESLFNGTDLTGWDGQPGAWEVADAAIRCTGREDGKRNWLIWRGGALEDFTLRLKFRFTAGNSGVQVRSLDLGGWQVRGYQVEIAEREKMGLWHHSLSPAKHRSHLATAGERVEIAVDGSRETTPTASAESVQASFRDGWNDLEVTAQGPRLIQKVNGVVYADLTDRERAYSRRSGVLAFQDHGRGTEVEFKDIQLRRPTTAATTPAPVQERMNVLFITVDDLNNDLGCYGNPLVFSPNVDRLSDRGLRFDRAYCQYPVCNPSRSSFMTGKYPDQTGVLSNGGDFRKALPDHSTLSQWFMHHGYTAARVGKIYHYGVPGQIGTDGEDDPGSWQEVVNPIGVDKHIEPNIQSLTPGSYGGTLSWQRVDSEDEAHTDGQGATACIGLLEKHHPDKTGRPFFVAMGFYRPHTPYVAPSHYFDVYPVGKIDPVMEHPDDRKDIPLAALHDRPKQRDLTVEQRKEIIQAYYASTTLMDAQVGRLLEALDRLDLTERTIIVFLSDHGYHLGAHGLWQKSDLFEGSARVPLIVVDPRRPAHPGGTRALAELVDLYPTLAELCGLPAPVDVSGTSLVPVLDDPSKHVRDAALTVTVSRGRQLHRDLPNTRIMGYTIRTPRYRYTEWGGGVFGRELYDYQTDPDEMTNLGGHPAHRDLSARLARLLAERVRRAQ